MLDFVTYPLILQMHVQTVNPAGCAMQRAMTECGSQTVHILLSENVKTTCAFPFILMPLTGAPASRWRQRHIFHC